MKEKSKRIILVIIMAASLLTLGLIAYNGHQSLSNANTSMMQNPNFSDVRGFEDKQEMPNDFDMMDRHQEGMMPQSNAIERDEGTVWDGKKLVLIGGISTLFSLSFIYFCMSRKNKEFYKIKDQAVIFALSNALLITYMTGGMMLYSNRSASMPMQMREQQPSEREKADLNKSNIADSKNIDLNEHSTDVTITQGGSYTFTGSFNHSIIVNAENEDVEIILNNVTIETENTAAIIGLAANKITIVTSENTENRLSDGGNSEYDGCIYSFSELVFEGSGTLIVNGNQNEGEGIATEAENITIHSGVILVTSNDDGINAGGDGATITINGGTIFIDAFGDGIDSNKDVIINGGQLFVMGSDMGGDAGIDTDAGYVINGGQVVALGSDMIELPSTSSQQKTIAFSLDERIEKDTLVTLIKDDEVILSFNAMKSFRTLIISSDTITEGNYSLYRDGTNTGKLEFGVYQGGDYIKGNAITLDNTEQFTVSENVTLFGNHR